MKYCAAALICILSLSSLLSCGLEEYYYLDYVPQGDYSDTNAIIRLRASGFDGSTYFDNFIIFYRIYISANNVPTGKQLEGQGSNNERTTINSTLNSDYIGLYSLTDITSTTVNTSNLESTFSNRRYFLLTLENANINSVLGSGSLGGTLNIAFPPNSGVKPTLTINGSSYTLLRADKDQKLLSPLPDRNFLNHSALYSNTNINIDSGSNVDVAAYNGTGTPQYTYVSMYIAARGTSLEMPPQTIYSQPTFIGIFRLADTS